MRRSLGQLLVILLPLKLVPDPFHVHAALENLLKLFITHFFELGDRKLRVVSIEMLCQKL